MASPAGNLAQTGSDTAVLVGLGLALAAFGGLLLLGARRRVSVVQGG